MSDGLSVEGGVKNGDGAIGRATKKVRRRSEGVSGLADPVVDVRGVSVNPEDEIRASWKDKLLGLSAENETMQTAEDFILQEDDANTVLIDGVPVVTFSDSVHQFIARSMARTAIVKLIGRKLSYSSMVNRLKILWQTTHSFQVVDLENDYYSVKFVREEDYQNALSGGPWTIFGHYLTVHPWSPTCSTTQQQPTGLLVWVRLPGLPEGLYSRNLLNYIGSVIGTVAKIDGTTDSKTRGQFARLAVFIDTNKPLVSRIMIDGRIQRMEYECLPLVCFGCGRFGHSRESCSYVNTPKNLSEEPISETIGEPKGSNKKQEDDPFGPWMLVDRRKPRSSRKTAAASATQKVDLLGGRSRFEILGNNSNEIFEAAFQEKDQAVTGKGICWKRCGW